MPRFLWIDTLKDGKTVEDLDLALTREEMSHVAAFEKASEHPFHVHIRSDKRGALLWFTAASQAEAQQRSQAIPVIKHGLADYELIQYRNFISVQQLFHQGGKHLGPPIKRDEPLVVTVPQQSYLLVLQSSDVDDVAYLWRLKKGGIAREVFDMIEPQCGFMVDILASDEVDAMKVISHIPSVRRAGNQPNWRLISAFPAATYDVLF